MADHSGTVLVWTAADCEGIDEYVSFGELTSRMIWGQFWCVVSEVRHVKGSGQVTFTTRADIEAGDSAISSSVDDVFNLWQQVDAAKQGTETEAAAAERAVHKAAAAAAAAAAEGPSTSVLANWNAPQGAAGQNTQQVAGQGTGVHVALQEQEHTDSSNSGPGPAATGGSEDRSLAHQQQLEYLQNCEKVHVLQTRIAAVQANTEVWANARIGRAVRAAAAQSQLEEEIEELQQRINNLRG